MAPGDPTTYFVGESSGPGAQDFILRIKQTYGLDKSLPEQLFLYIFNLVQGNLGYSIIMGEPVAKLILERLPYTLLLAVSGMAFALVLGLVLGIASSKKRNSAVDHLISAMALTGYSIPNFWLGLMFILLFSLYLGWLPTSGFSTLGVTLTGFESALDILRHLIMPTVITGLNSLGLIIRLTRSSMLESLEQDYITFARAKGLNERRVTYHHALRNALLPITTVVGLRIGFIFSGAVVTETVFGWPGIGRLLLSSMLKRDYPVILGIFIVISITVLIASLITDLVYCLIDPRIAYGKKGENS